MDFVVVVAVLIVLGMGVAVLVIGRRGPSQRGHHESLMGGAGRNVAQDLRAGRDESAGGG
ncbi:MAG TPA: hypothetical protein VFD41_14630 [Actinomycetales bacterium]|nr:hypothetical protein [Actinomycetales bacterium]